MNDDVPPSSEELDVAFTQGKNGKLVFARDAEGNFFLDSRGVYKKAMQQLVDSQRDHTDNTHDVGPALYAHLEFRGEACMTLHQGALHLRWYVISTCDGLGVTSGGKGK